MRKPHCPGPRQGHLCICVLCSNVPEVSGLWKNVKKSQAQLYYKTTPVGSKTGEHRPGWICLSIKRIKGWQGPGWAGLCCLRPHQHPARALVQGNRSRTTAGRAGREPRPDRPKGRQHEPEERPPRSSDPFRTSPLHHPQEVVAMTTLQ